MYFSNFSLEVSKNPIPMLQKMRQKEEGEKCDQGLLQEKKLFSKRRNEIGL